MALHMAFRGIESTAALKSHIEKRIAKISKFITYPIEIHITVSLEKRSHCAASVAARTVAPADLMLSGGSTRSPSGVLTIRYAMRVG